VVADHVSLLDDPPGEVRMEIHLAAQHEEGRLHTLGREDIEDAVRLPRPRPVVERECHHPVVRRELDAPEHHRRGLLDDAFVDDLAAEFPDRQLSHAHCTGGRKTHEGAFTLFDDGDWDRLLLRHQRLDDVGARIALEVRRPDDPQPGAHRFPFSTHDDRFTPADGEDAAVHRGHDVAVRRRDEPGLDQIQYPGADGDVVAHAVEGDGDGEEGRLKEGDERERSDRADGHPDGARSRLFGTLYLRERHTRPISISSPTGHP
jgi:hypothetical protein